MRPHSVRHFLNEIRNVPAQRFPAWHSAFAVSPYRPIAVSFCVLNVGVVNLLAYPFKVMLPP
jgi:hypothetical protein